MTRRKVRLAFICNDTARKASYNKRKKSLIKSVRELTTLCDVPACAIISSPFDYQPEVWPNHEGAMNVIDRYKISAVKKESRNVNQESFIMQRITKARNQVRKLNYDNCEQELNLLLFGYMQNNSISDDLTAEGLKDLDKLIEKKLKEVDCKIKKLNA